MLIVTRKVGEKIMITERTRGRDEASDRTEIVIAVTSVNGLQVKVGIEAPHGFAIDREEVYRKKQAAHEAACLQKQLKAAATTDEPHAHLHPQGE